MRIQTILPLPTLRPAPAVLSLLLALAGNSAAQSAPRAGQAVTLAAGDIIKLEVWREEDMSGEFVVDEGGRVTLPLIGERSVSGVPLAELREQLLQAFRVELQNPTISISAQRKIYVLGEVAEPGMYTVDPTASLAGAIALAGGATSSGDLRRVRVVRDGQVVLDGVRAETALDLEGVRSGDQIFVGQRNWFSRNTTFVVSVLLSVTSIVISMAR